MQSNKNIRVLVAEDDYLVSKGIERILRALGYDIAGLAADGEEAVSLVRSIKPDLVVMDIEMPNMNGLEATRIIQDTCPTPVVALTAYESPEFIERASRAGVSAYLTKPPDGREMERAIIIALARHRDLVELRQTNARLEQKTEELEKALSEIRTLRGIIPICCMCKKIRDDDGFWQKVEVYVRDRTEADFSHSYCPDCLAEAMRSSHCEPPPKDYGI